MGLTVSSASEYAAAVRKLLPLGRFWDEQLSDQTSDIYKWSEAKGEELARFKSRSSELLDEAYIDTTSELIDDWERVFDLDNATLETSERRKLLRQGSIENINIEVFEDICEQFESQFVKYEFPLKPSCFGYTRFDSRIATPAWFSVFYIYISGAEESIRDVLESYFIDILQANYIVSFFYS